MDKKAKKILFQRYWKNGWKPSGERITSEEDFLYAKSKNIMFDKIDINHDDCIKEIMELRDKINRDDIVAAFLGSLSTRRLELRSACASWTIANKLKLHTYVPIESGRSYEDGKVTHISYTCEVCKETKYGIRGNQNYEGVDLNVLNFERIKWGGIRLGDIIYTMFDLQQFLKEEITEPSKEDIDIFKEILNIIETSNIKDTPSKLRERIHKESRLKASKNEIDAFIEVLACIGVLSAKSYNRRISGKHDWTYITYWRGEDGYNQECVDLFFGKYLE